jgi:threonine/homoserine/homoserine lactone efflux protein
MDHVALLIFAGAMVVFAASPGPGIIALVAQVIGNGLSGAAAFATGLICGDLPWLVAAVSGLAVVAHTFQGTFTVIRLAGAAYLLYLAYRMWTAPAEAPAGSASPQPASPASLFFAGFSVSIGNPKVIGFYLALLPNLIDLGAIGPLGYAELVVVWLAVLIAVLGGYAIVAARARALFRSPRAIRLFNRTGGTLMAGAAVAVATR